MKTFCCTLLVVVCCCAAIAQSQYDKYLTAADVEKATGIKGVHAVAKMSVAGAGGDLNFANAAGELILMVQFTDAKNFESFQKRYGKGAVTGIGDQAIQGAAMPGMADNLLAFTKGPHCVVVTSFGDFIKQKVYLTMDQLTALAKMIASRM